ncbi:hypothetical protein PASE110613_00630 [Paenibacillus sediminis]|uniref:Lipoprotein n=1 Tax=Paenibacillus sediminis TaxID=664909 RepID=A0ABS4H067_9BACL|nr:hypothetical protein [Paenibacillus sediminis]MBP1935914.1 hypothetical protein [Paenibacillus sediminis]
MSETTQRMLLLSVALSLFITACVYTLHLGSQMDRALLVVRDNNYGQKRSVQSTIEMTDPETYSGAQVLQSIAQIKENGVAIKVDGHIFPETTDINDVDVSLLDLTKNYIVSYIRNGSGKLIQIVFNKR